MEARGQQTQAVPLTAEAAALLDALRDGPCNLTEARQRAGLGRHVFEAALEGLVEVGLVHRVATGRGVLLLPDRPGVGACVEQVKALWDARVRRVHDFLGEHELCPHRIVVAHAAAAWTWGEEITRWRLRCLEEAGLVQAVIDPRDHRCVTYRYLPAHPLARELLGEAGPSND